MPKVKKKRVGFVIDMTPLVDITFLLLTFFMFTAKFKTQAESEQKFVIKRPEATADTSKIPDKNLAVIKIAVDSATADTTYYYEMTNEQDRIKVWSQLEDPSLMEEHQIAVDLETLNTLVKNTRFANNNTQFAIDADRRLRFKWIQDAMDVLRKNKATVFNYVTKKKGSGL